MDNKSCSTQAGIWKQAKRGRLGITGAEREEMDSGPAHPYTAPRSQFPRSIKSDRAPRLFFGKTEEQTEGKGDIQNHTIS